MCFADLETCSLQLGRQGADRPVVRRRNRVVERLHRGANKKAQEKAAVRLQHPGQLLEGNVN